MSAVLNFPPRPRRRTVAMAGAKPAEVIKLNEGKAPAIPAARKAVTPEQIVDSTGQVREKIFVSPMEGELIQELFGGLEAAAQYLLQQVDVPAASHTYRANKLFDGWRILWISGPELDLFNYIKNHGFVAAASLLFKQAEQQRASEKRRLLQLRRQMKKIQNAHRAEVV